jgi:hypothetical protein
MLFPMKRASARLIILLLTIAAVVWRYAAVQQRWWTCSLSRMTQPGYCSRAAHLLATEVGIVLLIAAAAFVWTRQLPEA